MLCVAATGCDWFQSTASPDHRVVWHVAGVASAGPAAYDGITAFFRTADRQVIAIDGETGGHRWTAQMGSERSAPVGSAGCTVVAEVVACGDSNIVAFRRSDGAIAWRFAPRVGYYPGYFRFTAHGSVLYTGSPSGTVYAIDALTGASRWETSIFTDSGGVNITEPSIDGDLVVAPYTRFTKPRHGGVVGIEAGTGRIRWVTEFPRPAPDSATSGTSTVIAGNVVFASSEDGRIHALDRTTGSVLWNFPGVGNHAPPHPTPTGPDSRHLAVSGTTLFANSFSGWFVAYDIVSRKERWRVNISGSTNASRPVVDGSIVYTVFVLGGVVALSTTEPQLLWKGGAASAKGFYANPAVGTDRIFLSSLTGFWALRK